MASISSSGNSGRSGRLMLTTSCALSPIRSSRKSARFPLALGLLGQGQTLVHSRHQLGPTMAKGVKGAAPDQAFRTRRLTHLRSRRLQKSTKLLKARPLPLTLIMDSLPQADIFYSRQAEANLGPGYQSFPYFRLHQVAGLRFPFSAFLDISCHFVRIVFYGSQKGSHIMKGDNWPSGKRYGK